MVTIMVIVATLQRQLCPPGEANIQLRSIAPVAAATPMITGGANQPAAPHGDARSASWRCSLQQLAHQLSGRRALASCAAAAAFRRSHQLPLSAGGGGGGSGVKSACP